MQILMKEQAFTGVKYDGKVFDCGSKLGFLTANVVFALDRDDIRDGFLKELRNLDLEDHL
jgi:UTP--glucose-1-phosphate uridylyltransferase